MLRRINFYTLGSAFGLSVLLILAGSRYTENPAYRPGVESRRNIKIFQKVEKEDYYQLQPLTTNLYSSGSPELDKIYDYTRDKIREELRDYNFSYSGVNALENLVIEDGGNPLRSLIVSTWRSGTTFLGEVLNSLPGNFYHYEPLLKFDIIQIRGPPHDETAMSYIKDMLECNFKSESLKDYFEFGKENLHQFRHNTRLWDHCKYIKTLCFDADFTSRFCQLFPFQSMKVVRIRLRLIQKLLQDEELNLKVILLIRDPRGVMESRQHREFCAPSPDCWMPELLCADMISDYVTASRLLASNPNRLKVIRYEELALNPRNVTYEIFKFLGLSIMPSVDNFLNGHTNKLIEGVSSTFRVSREVPFKWKKVLGFPYVEKIQMVCKEAMDLWGYGMAHNASHYTSENFDPLLPYIIQQ